MKITIDTKEDSHEEIQKAIKMLQSLVGEHPYSNQQSIFADNPNSSSGNESPAVSAFGAMFGDDAPSSNQSVLSSTVIEDNKIEDLKYKEPVELEVY
jgi:hypothetical protein